MPKDNDKLTGRPENPGQQGRDNAANKKAENAEAKANRPAEVDEAEVVTPEDGTQPPA